jgi:hypothetical protein
MTAELVFNVLMGIGIVLYLLNALKLPTTDNTNDVLGASGFPVILACLALIVLTIITVKVIKERHKVRIPMFELHKASGRILFLNVLLLGGYIALLDILGFALATAAYLFLCANSIGFKKLGVLTVFSVLTSALLTFLFGTIFYVPLPRGIEFLRELSYLVY